MERVLSSEGGPSLSRVCIFYLFFSALFDGANGVLGNLLDPAETGRMGNLHHLPCTS